MMFYQFALMPKITQYGSSNPKYLSEENICWGMLIVAHLFNQYSLFMYDFYSQFMNLWAG